MDTGASEPLQNAEIARLQQELGNAAKSFNALELQVATLQAQLQQASLKDAALKSSAHANKPQPFRGYGSGMHLGSWIFSVQTYFEATGTDPSR